MLNGGRGRPSFRTPARARRAPINGGELIRGRVTIAAAAARQICFISFAKATLTAKKLLRPIKSYPAKREEALSAFLVNSKTPIADWKRDGNLIRRGRPNKSRAGSSKGKLGKTVIRGDEKVIKDDKHIYYLILAYPYNKTVVR